ncbi:MAG: homoserine kinase [Candidatus Dormibacteraceae bacterium]
MKIRVPGSIANLGPGVDILAMAVELWLEVEAEPAALPSWTFEGEGASLLSAGVNPLSRLRMRGRVRNGIPVGVGLGSSAAARLAAAALRGVVDPFRTVAEEEGHPDNAAAAALGGVRLLAGGHVEELPPPPLEVALMVAHEPVATDLARRVLPAQVGWQDAVFNAGRTAWLVHALHSGRWDLLGAAMDDRLHQPQRRRLYPWVGPVLDAARASSSLGAAVCGAGPSVFAFCAPGGGEAVAAAMAAAAAGRGRPLVTRVSPAGMGVEA